MEYVALLRGINVGGTNKVVMSELREQVAGVGGLVWFCGPGVLRVVGCYWWCCAHWRAYWLGESQPSALWGCSSL